MPNRHIIQKPLSMMVSLRLALSVLDHASFYHLNFEPLNLSFYYLRKEIPMPLNYLLTKKPR